MDIRIATIFFFLLQVYTIYNYYFRTGWDVDVVYNMVRQIVKGVNNIDTGYFSRYPNNLFLLYIFSIIRKIDLRFGILDTSIGIMGFVIVQCILCAVTGYLLYKIILMLLNRKWAWVGWGSYIALVGISPWISIPYSDGMGLIFPTAILYLYLKKFERNFMERIKWFLISLIAWWGYNIKPQCFVIFIAVLVCEGIRYIIYRKKNIINFLMAVLGLVIAALIVNICISSLGLKLDSEKAFGPEHFIMMGLCEEHSGLYCEESVQYSASFETKNERRDANISEIFNRVKNLGLAGLAKHLVKKTLVNYSDGTFFWEGEGNFYNQTYEYKNRIFSPWIQSYYYCTGANQYKWVLFAQGSWLFVLTGLLGVIWKKGFKNHDKLFVPLLALIGLNLFVLLFEARSRYLFTYIPIFIIVSTVGWNNVVCFLNNTFIKKIKRQYQKILNNKV